MAAGDCEESFYARLEKRFIIVYSSSCTCNDIAACRIVGGCSFYISARRKNE